MQSNTKVVEMAEGGEIMGLDCSHNAFHGAYSSFNRFRQVVCHAIGGSFPPHCIYNADGTIARDKDGNIIYDHTLDDKMMYCGKDLDAESGMYHFLTHSDCDGEISPEMCIKVANDLEAILPQIEALPDRGSGHIVARGGYAEVLKKFVAGCRLASENNEPLVFD